MSQATSETVEPKKKRVFKVADLSSLPTRKSTHDEIKAARTEERRAKREAERAQRKASRALAAKNKPKPSRPRESLSKGWLEATGGKVRLESSIPVPINKAKAIDTAKLKTERLNNQTRRETKRTRAEYNPLSDYEALEHQIFQTQLIKKVSDIPPVEEEISYDSVGLHELNFCGVPDGANSDKYCIHVDISEIESNHDALKYFQ